MSTVLLDHFTGADGTSLPSHLMDVGSGWVSSNGSTWQIQSNQAKKTASGSSAQDVIYADAGVADVTLSADITNPADAGLIMNYQDDNNYWMLELNTAGWIIYEHTSGGFTNRGAGYVSATGTHTWKGVTSGDTISLYLDGTLLGSYTASGGRPLKACTKCGIRSFNADAATFDNFLVSSVVSIPVDFYVDGLNGSDSADGLSWNHPVQTIAEAILRCVAGRGDVVHIANAVYTESLLVDKDGIQFTAASQGTQGPTILPISGPAMVVYGHAVGINSISLVSPDNIAIVQLGNEFSYSRCNMSGPLGGVLLTPDIDNPTHRAAGGRIYRARFQGCVAGPGLQFVSIGGDVGVCDTLAEKCVFVSNLVDVASTDAVGGDAPLMGCTIRDSDFLTPDADLYIDLAAGMDSEGMIGNCRFNTSALTSSQVLLPASGKVHLVGVYDARGLVDTSSF